MKRSEKEAEVRKLLETPGAVVQLPAGMTLNEAGKMDTESLVQILVGMAIPVGGWEPESAEDWADCPNWALCGNKVCRWGGTGLCHPCSVFKLGSEEMDRRYKATHNKPDQQESKKETHLPDRIYVGQHIQSCCGVPTLYTSPNLELLSYDGYQAAADAYNAMKEEEEAEADPNDQLTVALERVAAEEVAKLIEDAVNVAREEALKECAAKYASRYTREEFVAAEMQMALDCREEDAEDVDPDAYAAIRRRAVWNAQAAERAGVVWRTETGNINSSLRGATGRATKWYQETRPKTANLAVEQVSEKDVVDCSNRATPSGHNAPAGSTVLWQSSDDDGKTHWRITSDRRLQWTDNLGPPWMDEPLDAVKAELVRMVCDKAGGDHKTPATYNEAWIHYCDSGKAREIAGFPRFVFNAGFDYGYQAGWHARMDTLNPVCSPEAVDQTTSADAATGTEHQPCPFCGSTNTELHTQHPSSKLGSQRAILSIECQECWAKGPGVRESVEVSAEVRIGDFDRSWELWDRRAVNETHHYKESESTLANALAAIDEINRQFDHEIDMRRELAKQVDNIVDRLDKSLHSITGVETIARRVESEWNIQGQKYSADLRRVSHVNSELVQWVVVLETENKTNSEQICALSIATRKSDEDLERRINHHMDKLAELEEKLVELEVRTQESARHLEANLQGLMDSISKAHGELRRHDDSLRELRDTGQRAPATAQDSPSPIGEGSPEVADERLHQEVVGYPYKKREAE